VLEDALLQAAWEEVPSVSYAKVTIEAVPGRAGAHKTMIYRPEHDLDRPAQSGEQSLMQAVPKGRDGRGPDGKGARAGCYGFVGPASGCALALTKRAPC
jgi:hypothetical protein